MPKIWPLPSTAWRLLFWLQVAAVTVLMLLPRPPAAIDTGWDKFNHVLAFAGPAFAGLAALSRPWWKHAAWLGLGLMAWGASLEWAQGLVPPRTPSLADLVADAVGVLLGGALYALAGRWVRTPPA